MTVYQNDIGSYNNVKKSLPTDNRVHVVLNQITKVDQSFKIERKLVPMKTKVRAGKSEVADLSRVFERVKNLIPAAVNKSNYVSHCTARNEVEEESYKSTEVSLCVLQIEFPEEHGTGIFVPLLSSRFDGVFKEKSDNEDEYDVKLHFGTLSSETRQLKPVLEKYLGQNNEKRQTLNLLIINDTTKKVIIKGFDNSQQLNGYLQNLAGDGYEDVSVGFEFLSTFDMKDPRDLLPAQWNFSLLKLLTNAFNAQMQSYYILAFVALFTANTYYFEIDLGVIF